MCFPAHKTPVGPLSPPQQVSEALRERAARIYDKYGTLMLNTDGFTAEGLERKATCRWVSG